MVLLTVVLQRNKFDNYTGASCWTYCWSNRSFLLEIVFFFFLESLIFICSDSVKDDFHFQ